MPSQSTTATLPASGLNPEVLTAEELRVILMAKNGTTKRSDSNPVQLELIFSEIDVMPIR